MTKLLALLVTTAFAGIAQAAEHTAPASTAPASTVAADHAKDAAKATADHAKDTAKGAVDHAAKTATDHAKDAAKGAGDHAKGATDHTKDATKGDAHAKAGHHHHHHHKHHHHHHHKQDTKPAGQDMMNKDKTMSVTPNLGDSEHAPAKTGSWDSQNKTGEAVKPTSYSKSSNDHSLYQDWWSREYRDQGKAGIASATPGSPDGEMSK